jgi:hypothetical protein
MQNIIDYTLFKSRLLLANVAQPGDARDFLNDVITDVQEDFLTRLLGTGLYGEFVTWYETLPQDETNPFYNLLNGLTFSFEGIVYRWVGLKQVFARYVYYSYQELDITQTVSGGEVKTKSQNAVNSSPVQKMVTIWNEMVNMLDGYQAYMTVFFGTEGTINTSVPVALHKAPEQVKTDVTPGVISGTAGFTFDGTGGLPDWRGYNAYPERIGQGTLATGLYTWSPVTGDFTLTDTVLQPNEIFNFTFGLGTVAPNVVTVNPLWYGFGWCKSFKIKNSLGL